MDEKIKETAQEEPEKPVKTEDDGSKLPTTTLISRADLAAERLEKALRTERENLKMREALMVRDSLGGRTEAGQPDRELSESDKKKKGAKDFFKGTNLEEAIDKL